MQLTGPKTRSVFERYNIVGEGDLRAVAEKLDQAASIGTAPPRRATAEERWRAQSAPGGSGEEWGRCG